MAISIIIICALIISALCGFIAIPNILNFCLKRKIFDIPNSRKVHKNLVPRLGGISFIPSMLVAFILALAMLSYEYKGNMIQVNLWSVFFLLSLLIIYTLGVIDDLIGLGARVKFGVQIVAASFLPASGLYINNLYGLFGIDAIPAWIGMPLTVFTIVFVVNAMNLIDGIDGLCASISEVALAGFLYAFYEERLYVYCILIAGLMGVLIPYLYYNLFGDPNKNRKIFMGDSGSLTLGFILSFLSVKLSMNNSSVMPFNPRHMPFALSLLLVPVFDVVRVILHRLRNHRSPFHADKTHIHHKFMRYGLTMHQSLIAIVAITIAFLVLNIMMFEVSNNFTIVVVVDILLYTALHMCLNRAIKRKIMEGRLS